jgi:CubicO group peptidase (beta-lactamase class C family)
MNSSDSFFDIKEKMKNARIPGLSLAAISNGQITATHTFGVSDNESNTPATDDTIFWACSLSKPVFAYLVYKLIERGKLGDFNLDTKLWEELDDPEFFNHDEKRKSITARMILSHQTGLPNEGKIDSAFNPGHTFRYSGEGYLYLQRVIEHLTGLPLEDLAQQEIFTLLQMNNSSFLLPEPENLAATHDENGIPKIPFMKSLGNNSNSAASLHTTARDYALFLEACLNDEKFMAEAFESQVSSMEKDYEALKKMGKETLRPINWGLGFGLQIPDNKEQKNMGFHWGHGPGARTFFVINPNTRSAVVYFTNSENGLAIAEELVTPIVGNTKPIIDYLFKKYDYKNLQELTIDYSTSISEKKQTNAPSLRLQWLQALQQAKSKPVHINDEKLKEYIGQYGPLSITLTNKNTLHLDMFGRTHDLVPLSETVFASTNDISFRLDFNPDNTQVTSYFLDTTLEPITENKMISSTLKNKSPLTANSILTSKQQPKSTQNNSATDTKSSSYKPVSK